MKTRNQLAINIRFHDGRYYGSGDWPPSPARVFQALIAGAGLGGPLQGKTIDALKWLEKLPPPVIYAPPKTEGTGYVNYVPNNDLDSKKGDPRKIGAIRTGKTFKVALFDEVEPFRYVWVISDSDFDQSQANIIVDLTNQIYQLGRGIDLAWGWGDLISENETSDSDYKNLEHFDPVGGRGGSIDLQTPRSGSFQSLENRYREGKSRFSATSSTRSVSVTFNQLPKPKFNVVSYNSPLPIFLFEFSTDSEMKTTSLPIEDTYHLTETIRDSAVARLKTFLPEKSDDIDLAFFGKDRNGNYQGTSKYRVKIVPLPSIGYHHADRRIRKVAIEISPQCRLENEDVAWAFSSLAYDEMSDSILVNASDKKMLGHYGSGKSARLWRTATPIVLPEKVGRRRIDPQNIASEAKPASEKSKEKTEAAGAVFQALRHANVHVPNVNVRRLQREPFESHGKLVSDFAEGTRFPKERLWHCEIEFRDPICGPLILGDGRFCGLGLFEPVFNK